jgi:YD repeat-containing protein
LLNIGPAPHFQWDDAKVTGSDANKVPLLVHSDVRGLTTLVQEYQLPGPAAYSALRSNYDALGRLTGTIDEKGNQSLVTYDSLSRIISTTHPDQGTTTYAYDLRSQQTESINASGDKTTHVYDPIGRVIQTDYLRPRQTTQQGPVKYGGSLPSAYTDQPPRESLCTDVSLFEPTRFEQTYSQPAVLELKPLSLTTGNFDRGEAQVKLPFEFSVRTGALRAAPGAQQRSVFSPGRLFTFPAGSQMIVSTDGEVRIGASDSHQTLAQTVPEGIFDVFHGDLRLIDRGLRYGISGTPGSRTLIIEWEGTLASRPKEPLLVRATFQEGDSGLQYEYPRIPGGAEGTTAGLRVSLGAVSFSQTIDVSSSAHVPLINAGIAYRFGASSELAGVRFTCSKLPQRIEIPMPASPNASEGRLQLGYRIFSQCPSSDEKSCDLGDMHIGYRDASPNSKIHPLGLARFSARPLARSANINNEPVDVINVTLPAQAQQTGFVVVVQPHGKLGPSRTIMDLAPVGVVETVYDPEERVHRTYDSTEPPYYIDTRAAGAQFDTRPLFDLTFDVQGQITDRSPSRASLASPTCNFAALAINSVEGVSGRALTIPAGFQCMTAIAAPISVSGFTAELWLHPQGAPRQPQSVFAADGMFSLGIFQDPNGNVRLQCTAGRSGPVVSSDVTVPTDVWSHVAIAFDGAQMRCAVNGVRQGQPEPATVVPSNSLKATIGDVVNLQDSPVSVDVDEVRLIAQSRTDAEILQDALRPLALGPPRGNLVSIDFAHPLPPPAGTSGQLKQADQSKAGNDGTLFGGLIVPGVQGMSFYTGFDPLTGARPTARVEIPHAATLRLDDKVTAELWVKTRSRQNGPARFIGKWSDATHPGWRLALESGSGRVRWEVVAQTTPGTGGVKRSVFVSQELVNDDVWHHLAATYDGRRLRVFKDGLPLHAWCGSGPREGVAEIASDPCPTPPNPEPCSVEITRPKERPSGRIGDAVCLRGSIDNTEPVEIANDQANASLDGFVDEVRVSNYAKREFEVASSARHASAVTQSLGRETLVRNRLPVDPLSNDLPYDLKNQPERETRGYDVEGRLISTVKHVREQRSVDDHFIARLAPDALGRSGLLGYPHGEVLANTYDNAGVQTSVVGYGPSVGDLPSQSQTYLAHVITTVDGKISEMQYGNGVNSTWTYNDEPAAVAPGSTPNGSFGDDTVRSAKVTSPRLPPTQPLSDRTYDWDVVGNLHHVHDAAGGALGVGQFDATYGYDDLRRVRTASITVPGLPVLSQTFDYDSIGNLALKDTVTQLYGHANQKSPCSSTGPLPHAIMRRTTTSTGGSDIDIYCYDETGRRTYSLDSPTQTNFNFEYYARGKVRDINRYNLSAPAQSASTSIYTYDGNGVRTSKLDSSGSTSSISTTTQVIIGPTYREITSSAAAAQPPTFEAIYSSGIHPIARRLFGGNGRSQSNK